MSTHNISKVYNCIKNIQYLLLPGTCILCQKSTDCFEDLCQPCRFKLPIIKSPCLQCALPLPPADLQQPICGSCLLNPPPFSVTLCAFDYRAPIDHLIGSFKYYAKLHIGRVLSRFLAQTIQHFYQHRPLPDLVVPMPLHPARLRHRGYNQAHEIAKFITQQFKLDLDPHFCLRQRNTIAQLNLSARQRQHNLRHAFTLNPITAAQAKTIHCIAVVDDVITTMSTAVEVTHLLKQSGVNEIHIWSLARTCK